MTVLVGETVSIVGNLKVTEGRDPVVVNVKFHTYVVGRLIVRLEGMTPDSVPAQEM